jgi:hypothetical protein
MPNLPHLNWTTPRVLALAGVSLLAGTALFGIANAQTPTPTPTGTPTQTREQKADEAINRFATNLGVDAARVREALKKTALQYLDEAVAAGRLTAEQAQPMRDAINSGGLGFGGFGRFEMHERGPGGPGGFKVGIGAASEALATYLGVTPEQLRTELNGKSLAQVASDHGKSADALKQFVVNEAQTRLNEAVTAGKIDQARATQALDMLKANVDAMINQVHQPRTPGTGEFRAPRPAGTSGAGFVFPGGI